MGVITAKDIARKAGCQTAAEWIRKAAARQGVRVNVSVETVCGDAVHARIDHGRWIGDCGSEDGTADGSCNGAEYVDPDEPLFFCLSCMNKANGGKARPVVFPSEEIRKQIEAGLSPDNYYSWNEQEEPHGV
jgi:hypothetical protein